MIDRYYEFYRNIPPEIRPGDWDLISQPIDYCFHNIYVGILWTRGGRGGFRPRFGLIHVDFDTLRRTPKDSFYEYQRLIRESRTERR